MTAEYLTELENAIRQRFRCEARHRETVFVHEKTTDDETVWLGDVEVFELTGCNESKRCYAWQGSRCGIQIVTVLHSRLIDSPHRAVQGALFNGVQPPLFPSGEKPTVFRQRMERAQKALYETQIKTEDWKTNLQTAQQTREFIFQKGR